MKIIPIKKSCTKTATTLFAWKRVWNFLKTYKKCLSVTWLKVQHSYGASSFDNDRFCQESNPGRPETSQDGWFFSSLKIWQPITLKFFDLQVPIVVIHRNANPFVIWISRAWHHFYGIHVLSQINPISKIFPTSNSNDLLIIVFVEFS